MTGPSEPRKSRIINNYETKNLNKSVYLLMNGAAYRGCRLEQPPIATIIMDNVNPRIVDQYWEDGLMIDFWSFIRMRKWLKEKIQQKYNSLK